MIRKRNPISTTTAALTLSLACAAAQGQALFCNDFEDSGLSELERELRDTRWTGTYEIFDNVHDTVFVVESVASGYIGGTMTHQEISPGDAGFLEVKVAGDVIPQLLVDIDGDGSPEWLDEDQIDPTVRPTLTVLDSRQLIRLKRFRGLDFRPTSNGNQWSQNREYRLMLEDGLLSGAVGVPPDTYGEGSGTTENGVLMLSQDGQTPSSRRLEQLRQRLKASVARDNPLHVSQRSGL